MTKDEIREVFLKNGFTIKEGQTDLKQYVYDAAYALLERAQPAVGMVTYQAWMDFGDGYWADVSEAVYKDCAPRYRRIVYAAPPESRHLKALHSELNTLRWMSVVKDDPWDQAIDAVRKRIAQIIETEGK